MRAALFTAGAVSLIVVGVGCAARPANAPTSSTAPEPDTVEAAQAQIDDARRALGLPLATTPGSSVADAPAAAPPPPPADAAEASKKSTSSAASSAEAESTHDACASSCRAIASMRRAVAALCRIAGDADGRCGDAKRTLDASEQRVASCRC